MGSVVGLAAATALALALVLLPPLLSDPAALASKMGSDQVRWSTVRGIGHVWMGTSSAVAVAVALGLGAVGAAPLWRASRVARWACLGLALTLAVVLAGRPAWIFNPLTLARYLLPALPLWAMAIGAGTVRVADALWRRLAAPAPVATVSSAAPAAPRSAPTLLPLAIAAGLLTAAWPWSPWPALLRTPNTQGLSYYFQFDYRPRHNPVVQIFDSIAPSPFWRSLATRAPGSVTVAVAPFRFESDDWLAPAWERESRQTVVAGMLSGGCGAWFFGEVPPDARFRLRRAVHLADAAALAAHRVDFVVWHKRSTVRDAQGVKRPAPECLAWLRGRMGTPSFEDDGLVVWALTGPAAAAPAVAAAAAR